MHGGESVSERPTLVCIHGALRRQCETCELADLVDELAEALRAVLHPWTITPEELNKARALLARIDGEKPK
jgi:hypothetical protein